jgi:hypothetical protein
MSLEGLVVQDAEVGGGCRVLEVVLLARNEAGKLSDLGSLEKRAGGQ